MKTKNIFVIAGFVLVLLFIVQTAIAHPPAKHKPKPSEQSQAVDRPDSHDQMQMPKHEEGAHEEEEANADSDHSHWGLDPDSSTFSKIMASFGKYHPLIVHFPIALFLTAAFAQILNMRSKNGAYDKTVILLVWLGAIGALAAGLLGWAHSGPVQTGENWVMATHRWLGTLMIFGGFIIVWAMKTKKANKAESDTLLAKNRLFNILLFGFGLLVALQGFLGGSLAHGGIKHLLPFV